MGLVFDPTTKKITVTGYSAVTPCCFNDLYVADKAGARELWTGTPALNITLTDQISPSDELALKIDFVLAGTNAGAGDTIVITGTDKDSGAQSETLATVADGTYTTTKWFETITDVDCTGFNTGTLTINQNQWGVIWKQGNNQYRIDSFIDLGDGTTHTYFKDISQQVVFAEKILMLTNLHLQFGNVLDITNKTGTDGCNFYFENSLFYGSNIFKPNYPLLFYDTTLIALGASGNIAWLQGGAVFWGCMGNVYCGNVIAPAVLDYSNSITREGYRGSSRCPVIADNWTIASATTYGLYFGGGDYVTLRNVKIVNTATDFRFRAYNGTVYAIDFDCGWIVSWYRTCSGKLYRQYSFNLKVLDRANAGIAGVSVILKDKDGNTTSQRGFDTTTNIEGKITEQIVGYGYYAKSSGSTMQSYSPHTLTIKKAGYRTYTKKLTLDEKVNWRITLERQALIVDAEVLA